MFFAFFARILYIFHIFGCEIGVEIRRRGQDKAFKCFIWGMIAKIFREVREVCIIVPEAEEC